MFILTYMVAAPLFGAWGVRGSRTRPIALGIGIWSIATILSGLAHGYPHLLAARAIVGIGEAALVAIAPALLADLFSAGPGAGLCALQHGDSRGGGAHYVVGGQVGAHFGWRAAFFVAGVPGIALAVAALWLPDPPRGIQDGNGARAAPRPHGSLALYLDLLRRGRYMLLVLGYAAYTFGLGGLAAWMPAFLERVRGIPKASAATDFGLIVVATGIVGTVVGGWLADYLLKYSRQVSLVAVGRDDAARSPSGFHRPDRALERSLSAGDCRRRVAALHVDRTCECGDREHRLPAQCASAAALTMFVIHLLGMCPRRFSLLATCPITWAVRPEVPSPWRAQC